MGERYYYSTADFSIRLILTLGIFRHIIVKMEIFS